MTVNRTAIFVAFSFSYSLRLREDLSTVKTFYSDPEPPSPFNKRQTCGAHVSTDDVYFRCEGAVVKGMLRWDRSDQQAEL